MSDPFLDTLDQALDCAVRDQVLTSFRAEIIRVAARLPRFRRKFQRMVEVEFASDDSCGGLIDWENFDVEKFAQLVTVVLQILAAFGVL